MTDGSALSSPASSDHSPTDVPKKNRRASMPGRGTGLGGQNVSPESKSPYTGPHSKRPVNDLPDLTQALIEQGIYAEYSSWRDSYFKWRRGEARGAKGENSHQGHVERKKDNLDFEYWYPNVSAFTFRRTCSYWVGVFVAEGAVLFMWAPVFSMFFGELASPQMQYALTKLVNVSGGTFFTIGCYMGYFELINMNVDVENGEAIQYFWCDWRDLRESLGLPWTSICGWMSYMIGALLFQVSLTGGCFTMDKALEDYIVVWTNIVGGLCFFFGGVCESIHNRVFVTLPDRLVWWVSIMNTIGGFCYWAAACPSLMVSSFEVDVIGLFGSVMYLFAGLGMLCMWRGEQFGLALISVLNAVHRDKGTKIAVRRDLRTGQEHSVVCGVAGDHKMEDMKDVVEPQLSWRGILFVTLYMFCGSLQVMECCASLALYLASSSPRDQKHHISTFLRGVINLMQAHMVLALCSACVRVPKEQPYRALVILMRVMVLIILGNSILTFELGFEDDAAYVV